MGTVSLQEFSQCLKFRRYSFGQSTDKTPMRHYAFLFTLLLSSLVFGQSFPIGTPNAGSLENAECLPEEGEGYMQLFRDVEHIWGTFPMIDMIEKAAADVSRQYPGRDRLQVEDISAKNGGDMVHMKMFKTLISNFLSPMVLKTNRLHKTITLIQW